MLMEFPSDREIRRTRETLLKQYSSECTAHGTYILTIAIGFLTLVEIFFRPDPAISLRYWPAFGLAFGLLFGIGLFILARLIFWAQMATVVRYVRPVDPKNAESFVRILVTQKKANITLLHRLERASILMVKKDHSRVYKSSRYRIGLPIILIFALPLSLIFFFVLHSLA